VLLVYSARKRLQQHSLLEYNGNVERECLFLYTQYAGILTG